MECKIGAAVTPRPGALLELLVVVGIAAVGLLFAAVLAFGPWPAVGTPHPPVVHFNVPAAVTAPH
jgi:hypothetical protein